MASDSHLLSGAVADLVYVIHAELMQNGQQQIRQRRPFGTLEVQVAFDLTICTTGDEYR